MEDTLTGSALAFEDEKVDQQSAHNVAASKDVAVAEINRGRDKWREERNQKVPSPVAGGSESHGLGTVPRRVDLRNQGPDHGTPGRGVSQYEQTGKDDENNASGGRLRGIVDVE